jgi:hypothetical protein
MGNVVGVTGLALLARAQPAHPTHALLKRVDVRYDPQRHAAKRAGIFRSIIGPPAPGAVSAAFNINSQLNGSGAGFTISAVLRIVSKGSTKLFAPCAIISILQAGSLMNSGFRKAFQETGIWAAGKIFTRDGTALFTAWHAVPQSRISARTTF